MNIPPQAKPFVNSKANNEFQLKAKSAYSGQREPVSFAEVVRYSSNSALFFYVTANCASAYYVSQMKKDDNQKYLFMALSLYLTQIVYNYLDLNSSNNLDRLEAISHN